MKIFFIGWGKIALYCFNRLSKSYKIVKLISPEGFEIADLREATKINNVSFELSSNVKKLKEEIIKYAPDLLVVVSYPKLIPADILNIPKFGAINVHTGALPKYRGYHPLNWALIKDEKQVGVTVHYLDKGMDSGNIIEQKNIIVSNYDDINTIKKRLSKEAPKILWRAIGKIIRSKGKYKGIQQSDADVIFAPKRSEEDSKISWENNTRDIFNKIRALKKPYPNAFSFNKYGKKIQFTESFICKDAGQVIDKIKDFYLISTGDGVILVKTKDKLNIGEKLI